MKPLIVLSLRDQVIIAFVLLAALCFTALPGQAATYNWTATDPTNDSWNTASFWGGTLPTASNSTWMNTADTYCTVGSGVNAATYNLIIGRRVADVNLSLTGGTLTLNSTGPGIQIGQYADSSGNLVINSGTLTTPVLSVGEDGVGTLFMTGGTLSVNGLFEVNRYDNTEGVNYAEIAGGSVSATSFSLHNLGYLVMTNATLTLTGDQRTAIGDYLDDGAITSFGGFTTPFAVDYDSGHNVTTVAVDNTTARMAGISGLLDDFAVTGDRSISFSYPSGERTFLPAPPAGVHPRVFFGPNDLPDIRNRLQTTQVGQAMQTELTALTGLLDNGASWYNSQPNSVKFMPDGTARIGNVGFTDKSADYAGLVGGNTTPLVDDVASNAASELSGLMTLEAFECLINQGNPAYATRATNLAAAMDTYANYATANPTAACAPFAWSFQMALCYDLNYWAMTADQRTDVRKCLATHIITSYVGLSVPPAGDVSNWNALNSNELLPMLAIEGEATMEEDNITAQTIKAMFDSTMTSYYKFLTYGLNPTGSTFEGMGKNEISAGMMIAFALRGYDYFGHPAVHKYMDSYRPAITEPFGYGMTEYDDTPVGFQDEDYSYLLYSGNDDLGLKWAFPSDTAADFLWRNYINTRWLDSTKTWQTFIDPRKLILFGSYNDMLEASIFELDPSTEDWTTENTAALGALDYFDTAGATTIARSGYDPNAAALQFHVRQNFGGHTAADRDTFMLSELGRVWVKVQGFAANLPGSYNSIIQIDGEDMFLSTPDGTKMIIPAKLAGWADSANASFSTGDATYAYSWAYDWAPYNQGSTFSAGLGYQTETATQNNFRRSNNQIPDAVGSIPFYQFPYFGNPNPGVTPVLYGIEKKAYNTMQQVFRTVGLVRGVKPYSLIIDDVQKDSGTHDYKWLAQIPNDLTILTGSALDAGLNPATDALLVEPSSVGTRRMLVRIISAGGTPIQASGTPGSSLAYIYSNTTVTPNVPRNRLVIERSGVINPNFKVMLYPYNPGDPLPTTSYNTTTNVLTTTIGSQVDTMTFYPRTTTVAGVNVTMSEFLLTRAGTTLLDYRNQIEPGSLR